MSKFEQDRINARRLLITRISEIDRITDEEIDHEIRKNSSILQTILKLSKTTRVERDFNMSEE